MRTARLDWHNEGALAAAAAAGPYALVLGASLQFEQWASLGANLWAVIGTLATVGTRVALVHVTGYENKVAQASARGLALWRLLSAPDHTSGCPALRPASASQPLGPR